MNTTQNIHILIVLTIGVVACFLAVIFRIGTAKRLSEDGPMDDIVLGQCEFNGIDAYDCTRVVATPHSDTTTLAAHVWLYGEAPSKLQKEAFANLVDNYDLLWGNVANELAALHPELTTPEEVRTHLRERVAVHIGEHEEDSVELVYEFDLPNEGTRGFFLRVAANRVVEAVIAE